MTLNSSRSISPDPSVSNLLNTSSGGIFDQSTPSSSSSSSSCCWAWRRVPVVSVLTVWSSAAPGAPPINLLVLLFQGRSERGRRGASSSLASSSSSGLTRRRRVRLMVCDAKAFGCPHGGRLFGYPCGWSVSQGLWASKAALLPLLSCPAAGHRRASDGRTAALGWSPLLGRIRPSKGCRTGRCVFDL